MHVDTICKREIVTVDAGAPVTSAALLMRSRHVGALVVTVARQESEHAVGLLTDRDIAVEVVGLGLDPNELKVGQVASRHLASVAGSASLGEAIAEMERAGVRRLLVTGPDGRLSGFVSSDDVLDALASELKGLSNAIHRGFEREGAERGSLPHASPRPVFLPYGTPGMQQPVPAS